LAIGDVILAANAFVSAAYLAQRNSNKSDAQRLGRRALLLGESPLIDEQQRTAIRERLRANPTFATLVK
jgi:hypothetical protein